MHAACSLKSSSIACSLIPLLHLRTTGEVAQDEGCCSAQVQWKLQEQRSGCRGSESPVSGVRTIKPTEGANLHSLLAWYASAHTASAHVDEVARLAGNRHMIAGQCASFTSQRSTKASMSCPSGKGGTWKLYLDLHHVHVMQLVLSTSATCLVVARAISYYFC